MAWKDNEELLDWWLEASDLLKWELNSLKTGIHSQRKSAEHLWKTFKEDVDLKKKLVLWTKLWKLKEEGLELFDNPEFKKWEEEIKKDFAEAKGDLEAKITDIS